MNACGSDTFEFFFFIGISPSSYRHVIQNQKCSVLFAIQKHKTHCPCLCSHVITSFRHIPGKALNIATRIVSDIRMRVSSAAAFVFRDRQKVCGENLKLVCAQKKSIVAQLPSVEMQFALYVYVSNFSLVVNCWCIGPTYFNILRVAYWQWKYLKLEMRHTVHKFLAQYFLPLFVIHLSGS